MQALLLIDVQKGFESAYWGPRNNPDAEARMREVLRRFRESARPVIHVQHLSKNPQSPLYPGKPGAELMDGTRPEGAEPVFQKNENSAFVGTRLEEYLKSEGIDSLVVMGFTTDHCVSTTVRMASNLGFRVTLLADATVTHDREIFGARYPAELVHSVSLASLSGEFATIVHSSDVTINESSEA